MESLDKIVEWVVGLIATLGGPGVGFAIAIENLFPPIPSEVILPLAGFAVAQGQMGFIEANLWATGGSVVGAWILYYLGVKIGRERLLAIARVLPLVEVADVENSERWFTRHGHTAVLFGRLLPGLRSLISIPAGLNRMPFWQFTAWTAIGSAVWNAALIAAGYYLGAQWQNVAGYIKDYQSILIVILVIIGVLLVWRRIRRVRRVRAESKMRHTVAEIIEAEAATYDLDTVHGAAHNTDYGTSHNTGHDAGADNATTTEKGSTP